MQGITLVGSMSNCLVLEAYISEVHEAGRTMDLHVRRIIMVNPCRIVSLKMVWGLM